MVNRSRGIFAISQGVKDNFCNLLYYGHVDFGSVKHVKSLYGVRSSSKNDGQNVYVAVHMGVPTTCLFIVPCYHML